MRTSGGTRLGAGAGPVALTVELLSGYLALPESALPCYHIGSITALECGGTRGPSRRIARWERTRGMTPAKLVAIHCILRIGAVIAYRAGSVKIIKKEG